jgi:hypothetical protein
LYSLLHAIFVALTDDGYDEVHKYYVSDDQNEEPEEPCQDFELFGAVNDWRGVVVADCLTQYYHKICCQLYTFVFFSRFFDNNLGHDSEASNHKKEIEEKDKKFFENNDQHSNQEADFSPDSYQKAEFYEAKYDYE